MANFSLQRSALTPGQSVWDLWWTNGTQTVHYPDTSVFSCQLSFHKFYICHRRIATDSIPK